ncbi:hypothetical protein QBE53_10495 [Vallitaleaceae bacterium 9-2]
MNTEFKLPGSSYEELEKIILAYGHANGEASLDDLSQRCGVPSTQISRNSGFLLATGIIEGARNKSITESGNELSRAIEHGIADEIQRLWKDIAIENDFFSKMLSAIRIRNGMDIQSLKSHIAYSSGQKSNNYVKIGSSTIIEILKLAKLVEEEEGKIVAISDIEKAAINKETHQVIQEPVEPDKQKFTISSNSNNRNQLAINIDINLDIKVEDLDELGTKLNKLISDLNQQVKVNIDE